MARPLRKMIAESIRESTNGDTAPLSTALVGKSREISSGSIDQGAARCRRLW